MNMTEQVKKKRKKQASGLTLKQQENMENVLTKALGVNVKFKKPSKILEAALDALKLDFGKLQSKVDKVFEIGRKEHFQDIEIGEFVRERMKDGYSRQTIWRVLEKYPNSIHTEMSRENSEFGNKMLPNERETSKQEQETVQQPTEQEPIKITDPHRFYREKIAAKNEEIAGLKKQLVQANKRIADLEDEVKRLKK